MDELPAELLLAVLAAVRDGRTLLAAVPLVCRRWRTVSRDPRLWADVDLTVRESYDSRDGLLADLGVLLHAPRLRRLDFNLSGQFDLNEDDTLKISALRRTSVQVREVHLPKLASTHYTAVDLAVHFLWRQRDEVRVLAADIGEDEGPDFEEGDDGEVRPLTFLGVLAKLHRLTDLELRFVYFDYLDNYNDKLAAGLPGLRRLVLRTTQETTGLTEGDQLLMKDLLAGAAESLRAVTLAPYTILPPEIQELLERCSHLRHLDVNLFSLEAVRGMSHLDTLRLHFDAAEYAQMSSDYIKQWCGALQSSVALDRLVTVRRLELHTFADEAGVSPEAGRRAPVHEAAFDVLLAAVRAACNATSVRLFLTNRGRVAELLACLPASVRCVEVNPLGPDGLQALAGLPQLTELSGQLEPQPQPDGTGMLCGCGPEGFDHCKSLVEAFKIQRPDVRSRLRIGTDAVWYSEEDSQ